LTATGFNPYAQCDDELDPADDLGVALAQRAERERRLDLI
jgi:hypothetical protein